ncbi:protease modulator HflC [Luteibacter sp. 621]|jgi:membrane protease subunit HflC|uniref:protease modulator HflC n=1 Tax=Luteibacter sp. 621 TaxID=3373916 RepID=UPI003D1CDC97
MISGLVVVALVLLGFNSVFVVKEGQNALLLQFGRIVRSDYQPGLHFKVPLAQQAVLFDNRILGLDAPPERYFTKEKKTVAVDFYVKWRIADNAAYYRATAGDPTAAIGRLTPVVKDALRDEFNSRPLEELISGGRKDITGHVRERTDAVARKTLGVSIVDVRIKRIDLPEEVSGSVYKRMRTERTRLANELRSTGQENAQKIHADADRQRAVILADANRDATSVRGDGDAKAAAIYASAYGQDPEFFAFYRSMAAYRKAFADGKSTLVLKPDSEFLRYLNDGPGRQR